MTPANQIRFQGQLLSDAVARAALLVEKHGREKAEKILSVASDLAQATEDADVETILAALEYVIDGLRNAQQAQEALEKDLA